MINQQILDYIKQQSQQGISKDVIKNSLLTNGWQVSDIEEAYTAIQAPPQPPGKKKHRILWIIIVLVVVTFIFRYLGSDIPVLRPFLSLSWMAVIFIGIPMLVYEEAIKNRKMEVANSSSPKISTPNEQLSQMRFRKPLLKVYSVGLVFSFMMAFGSIFVFDGESLLWARYGIFWSAIALPIVIIIAMIVSKKSLVWLLLPALPLATLFYFANSLENYGRKSDEEFCKKAMAQKDRPDIDNITSFCSGETDYLSAVVTPSPNPTPTTTESFKKEYKTVGGFEINPTIKQGANNLITWRGAPLGSVDVILVNLDETQIGYIYSKEIAEGDPGHSVYWTGESVSATSKFTMGSNTSVPLGGYKIIILNTDGTVLISNQFTIVK